MKSASFLRLVIDRRDRSLDRDQTEFALGGQAAFPDHDSTSTRFLRGEIARRINLKFAPDIRFAVDDRFDEAERIERLLRTPAVQRDLHSKRDDQS